MYAKSVIALSVAIAFAATSAASAHQTSKGERASAAQARAAFAQSFREVAPISYDTVGAPIFASQLSESCTLSLKQFHRC